jgi:FdhD protein
MNNSRQIRALHIDSAGNWFRMEETACEYPLRIILNGKSLATLLCTPDRLEELVVGFLASKRIIQTREDIGELVLDPETGTARIKTVRKLSRHTENPDEPQNSPERIASDVRVTPDDVLLLHRRFQEASALHRNTSAAHSAAICTPSEILVLSEDIGRHNAIDKAIGRCLLEKTATTDRILALSCRISSEIVLKAAAAAIPVLASKSGPTDRGVDLAAQYGITLIGFIYKSGMNVYTAPERVKHGAVLAHGQERADGQQPTQP